MTDQRQTNTKGGMANGPCENSGVPERSVLGGLHLPHEGRMNRQRQDIISAGLAGRLSGGLLTRCARVDPFSVCDGFLCDGFRMPAHRERRHAHDGAGVRKPPRKEGAGLGHPAQRALWGIGRHWACSKGPVQRASTPRMSGVGAMVGQTSVENAGSEAFRGLLHGSDRD